MNDIVRADRASALDLVLEVAELLNGDLDRYTRGIGITRARLHLLRRWTA